jgi:hypothetical protein
VATMLKVPSSRREDRRVFTYNLPLRVSLLLSLWCWAACKVRTWELLTAGILTNEYDIVSVRSETRAPSIGFHCYFTFVRNCRTYLFPEGR